METNKQIVKELKDSIAYRNKHKKFIKNFLRAVEKYFLDKYDYHVRTLTGVTWFAVEQNIHYYYGGDEVISSNFEFTAEVLADFCKEFECEFEKTACDGDRYIFSLKDVDMSNAFLNCG